MYVHMYVCMHLITDTHMHLFYMLLCACVCGVYPRCMLYMCNSMNPLLSLLFTYM